jgi:RNA polymerase sigma-70 factor (ECF subfamily)
MSMATSNAADLLRFPDRRRASRAAVPHGVDDPAVMRAVDAAKRGDWDAIRYLYVRYADAVHRQANRVLADEHEAEDVTQQVFLKLRTAIERYEPRTTPFRSWLLRVARNVALDDLRARRPDPTDDVDAHPPPPASTEFSALREALTVLPQDQRNVLYLRHVLGLAPGEIAERLGKSESAVHGLHHRGRVALRAELERLRAAPATRRPAPGTKVYALDRARRARHAPPYIAGAAASAITPG